MRIFYEILPMKVWFLAARLAGSASSAPSIPLIVAILMLVKIVVDLAYCRLVHPKAGDAASALDVVASKYLK